MNAIGLRLARQHMRVALSREHLYSFFAIMLSIFSVAFVDIASGSATQLYPLYFVPITIAGSSFGKFEALGVAQICTVAWMSVQYIEAPIIGTEIYWMINGTAQWCSFSFVALLVSRLREISLKVEEEARIDLLTQLPNIRGFSEQALLIIGLCRRGKTPLVIAYIDLDNFKNVNDTLGHNRGNRILQIAASAMKSTFRSVDLVGRVGGDEFVVVLPHASGDTAYDTLERVRSAVESAMRAENCSVTATIGAVAFGHAPTDVNSMIDAADQTLLRAKALGKNLVLIDTLDSSSTDDYPA